MDIAFLHLYLFEQLVSSLSTSEAVIGLLQELRQTSANSVFLPSAGNHTTQGDVMDGVKWAIIWNNVRFVPMKQSENCPWKVSTCLTVWQRVNWVIVCHRLQVPQNNHRNPTTAAFGSRGQAAWEGAHVWRAGVQRAKETVVRHNFTPCWAALQPVLDWDGLMEPEREMLQR